VTSLAFSPDGRTLASGSFDLRRPVILWDVASRHPRLDLKGHTGRVRGVAFSPDGLVLASTSDDHADRLWNVRDGSPILTIPELPDNWATGVAFSPDGHIVAAARSNRIVLDDSTSGKIRTLTAADDCFDFAFSPDGGRLYCGHGDGSITTWDVARSRQVASVPAHDTAVYSLALSADGATLVSARDDRTVRLWDTITRQELLRLTDCKARVNAVAFSPDGNALAAADHSGTITIWVASSGDTEFRRVPGTPHVILRFTPGKNQKPSVTPQRATRRARPLFRSPGPTFKTTPSSTSKPPRRTEAWLLLRRLRRRPGLLAPLARARAGAGRKTRPIGCNHCYLELLDLNRNVQLELPRDYTVHDVLVAALRQTHQDLCVPPQ
jgi:WD40 repeat protein